MKEKYNIVKLTEEEKLQSQLNFDKLSINADTMEFDLKQMEKSIKLNLPIRDALEQVKIKEKELFTTKSQKKMYQFRIRTGTKKVPTQ